MFLEDWEFVLAKLYIRWLFQNRLTKKRKEEKD
jgi:hypothetical protein